MASGRNSRSLSWLAVLIGFVVVVSLGIWVGVELASDDDSSSAAASSRALTDEDLQAIAVALSPPEQLPQGGTTTDSSQDPSITIKASDIARLDAQERRRAQARTQYLRSLQAAAQAGAAAANQVQMAENRAQLRRSLPAIKREAARMRAQQQAIQGLRLEGQRQAQLEQQRRQAAAAYAALSSRLQQEITAFERAAANEVTQAAAEAQLRELAGELAQLEQQLSVLLAQAREAAATGDLALLSEIQAQIIELLTGALVQPAPAPPADPPPSNETAPPADGQTTP